MPASAFESAAARQHFGLRRVAQHARHDQGIGDRKDHHRIFSHVIPTRTGTGVTFRQQAQTQEEA